MKSLVALAALAAAAVAAPAFAQPLALPASLAPNGYNASIGYTNIGSDRVNLGAVTIRAGAGFGKYFGVEGEGSFGVDDHNGEVGTLTTKYHVNDQYAGYGVVHYPLLPNTDVFVRGGYGHTDVKYTSNDLVLNTGVSVTTGRDSWNYGAGAQYLVDGKNGVRLDYTRHDFVNRGAQNADVWTISYVHKF